MKTKTFGWIVALAMAASPFVGCSQPATECQVALASTGYGFAARFKLKSNPSAECAPLVVPGDIVGLEFYHPATADGTTYDATKTTIAVQADSLGNEDSARADQAYLAALLGLGGCTANEDGTNNSCMDNDAKHTIYAMGEFGSVTPDGKDICTAKMDVAAAAERHYPELPEIPPDPEDPEDPGMPAQPAKTVRYEWSNFDVFVTAAAPGTQFKADLKYTVDACTFEYQVVGLWPGVYCYDEAEDGSLVPNDAWCHPCADPENGIEYGSGISPDIRTMCDPDLLLCVLKDKAGKPAEDIPQFLDEPITCDDITK